MATVLGDSRQKETLNTLDYTSSSAAYEVALLNSKPITNPDLGYNFQPTYSSNPLSSPAPFNPYSSPAPFNPYSSPAPLSNLINPLYTTPSPKYIVAAGVLITLLFAIKR